MTAYEKKKPPPNPFEQGVLPTLRVDRFLTLMETLETSENVAGLEMAIRAAERWLDAEVVDAWLLDGNQNNIVQGATRKKLQQGVKKSTQALKKLRRVVCDPDERAAWRKRRRNFQYKKLLHAFTEDDFKLAQQLFIGLHAEWEDKFKRYENNIGPIFNKKIIYQSVKQIFNREKTSLREPTNPAIMHLALFLAIYQDQAMPNKPEGIAGALHKMASTLFACLCPKEAGASEAVSIQCGWPMNFRRDDEQHIVHFFFEPSGEFRCVLLGDNPRCQRRLIYPPINDSSVCQLRIFWIHQNNMFDSSAIKVSTSPFVALITVDPARLLQYKEGKPDSEMMPLAKQCIRARQIRDPNDQDARWVIELAKKGKKAMYGFFNYGLSHASFSYSTAERILRTDDQDFISAIQTEGKYEILLGPDPPLDLMDFAMEELFWTCCGEERRDITTEEAATVLFSVSKTMEKLFDAYHVLESKSVYKKLQEVMQFLVCQHNRASVALVAEDFRCNWYRMGRPVWHRKWLKKGAYGSAASIDLDELEEDDVDYGLLLMDFAEKRAKNRELLKGLRRLARTGLVKCSSKGVVVHVNGSNSTLHAPGGKSTRVCAPLSAQNFTNRGIGSFDPNADPNRTVEFEPGPVPDQIVKDGVEYKQVGKSASVFFAEPPLP